MPEGRGVTNYAVDKPSYAFSTDTTEFDDALMKRGIITFEQAMIAKGASPQEARRLANTKFGVEGGGEGGGVDDGGTANRPQNEKDEDGGEGGDGGAEEEDDEFLEKYRRMRLEEMKQDAEKRSRPHSYGDVFLISRPDWTREVNDASRDGRWVVVNLTRGSDSAVVLTRHLAACQAVEDATTELAARHPDVKFVAIAASAANERWPPENLPTMFCYRDGKLQRQLIGIADFGGHGVNADRVEWRLSNLGVLETDLEYDPERSNVDRVNSPGSVGRSQFGGKMSEWATRRDSEEDLSDID